MTRQKKQQVWFQPADWGAILDVLASAAELPASSLLTTIGRKQVLRVQSDLRRQLGVK